MKRPKITDKGVAKHTYIFTDFSIEQFAAEGIRDLERSLARHAAFEQYLNKRKAA